MTSPLPIAGDPRERYARSTSASSIRSNDASPRSPSVSSINRSSHRQSFADNLRNIPPSPRQRQHSFTQSAAQGLLNYPPPANRFHNPQFANREWRDITAGELVSTNDVKWMELDSTVEDATMVLCKSQPSVVLIRESASTTTAISTFDFKDLNSYLLTVVGLAKPEDSLLEATNAMVSKVQKGEPITLREIQPLWSKETPVTLSAESNLAHAVEVLGSGIHRLIITDSAGKAVGILSQLQLVEFFWNEGVNFASIEQLYPIIIRDLHIATKHAISINSDAPLSDALSIMNNEGLTSIAVVDNGHNVVGNISAKDVRHLTSSSSAHLLGQSCMHFISIILNERGVEMGRDTYPVFYVNPYSTLAHTVAKLVATRSHRMWVVESASPSPSAPATPSACYVPSSSSSGAPPSPQLGAAVPASAMMGARLSGRLSGVISLTDVLNAFAKSTGLNPKDPAVQRERRRKSSTSSMRASVESVRAGSIDIRR